jgi:integrase
MASIMGRKRKTDLGLEQRVYQKHGAFYYVHPGGRWEHLGTDKDQANGKARIYNDPDHLQGTLSYWLDQFLMDCERRVKLKSSVKGVKLSERTHEDYSTAFGTRDEPGPIREFFAPPRTPLDVTPDAVQQFLRDSAELGRAVQGNRQRAALSACFGWLLRHPDRPVPGLLVNPCLRASGVQRNPESKRERYVTDDEYHAVYAEATTSERLLMELTYRTLQRPESDIIWWDRREVIRMQDGHRVLDFKQFKTNRRMVIAFTPELDRLMPAEKIVKAFTADPVVRKQDGGFYTYDGISSMLKRSIKAANKKRTAQGLPKIPSFGFRDLKGKGATDMWLAREPIEQIQALLGHASKTTTEIYVKQRWREAVQPNVRAMKGA